MLGNWDDRQQVKEFEKFLSKKIKFLDIGNYIETLMEQHSPFEVNSLEDILYVKKWTEKKFTELI